MRVMESATRSALRFAAACFPRFADRNLVLLAVIAAATVLGLLFRLAAAGGDLGIDEVLSLNLVARLGSLGQVFWGLSHDNNHFLNSAWIYAMGQGRPDWVYRFPAILLGTLTIPAAARLCWRRTAAAGAFAAILSAIALPLVDFGSEARGYAGLSLATILAIDQCDRAIAAHCASARQIGGAGRETWRLGFAVGFGLLSHVSMVFVVAVLGLTTLIRIGARRRAGVATVVATVRIFAPSFFLALPAFAALGAGIIICHGFTIGDTDPFSWQKLFFGFGGMLQLTSGLPEVIAPSIIIIAVMIALAGVARFRLIAHESSVLGVAALVVLPIVIAAARLPNVAYCRYFSLCAIVLLALQAETLGSLWQGGDLGKRRALAALTILGSGSLALDWQQWHYGRGGFGETLALMTTEAEPTYFASRPFMARLLIDYVGRRDARSAAYIAQPDFCGTAPDWYIAVGSYDSRPQGAVTLGPDACQRTYRRRESFAASALSGTQWTVYHKM